jgi:hypothetical protein
MRCVSYVDDPAAVNLGGYFEQEDLAYSHRDNAVINVHIVDQMEWGGIFNPLYDAIFIPRRVYTNDDRANTLPHEIGHYLSLMHTHFGYRVPCLWEPVRRGYYPVCPPHYAAPNTCSVTGDGFCDTPGDPNQSGQVTGCLYNGGERDYLNELYNPAEANYMAYSPNACRSWFSNKQGKAMMWSLALQRAPERARGNWGTDGTNAFDSFEPDNGDRAARPLPLNGSQRHSFHSRACSDSEDWIRFQVPAGGFLGAYFVEATGVNGAAHPVNSLELFPEIGGDADDGFVAGARITVPFTTPNGRARLEIPCRAVAPNEWYLVRISNGGTQYGQYDVSLTNGPATGQTALPTISGPDQVCSTGATFTLNNAPAGATVTWTASANITPRSGSGTTATVSAVAYTEGEGTITFVIAGGCTSTLNRTVQVGVMYNSSDYPVGGPTSVSCDQEVGYSTNQLSAATNYQWFWPSGWNYVSGQGTRYLTVKTPSFSSSGQVGVRVATACDPGGSAATLNVSTSCSGGLFALYPNPADSYVEIAPDETKPDNQAAGQDFEVVINDNFAQEKLRAKTLKEAKEKKLKLDVTSLSPGIYVVQIIHAGGVEQKQLEIMR